jgi:hypothetical protein
MPSIYLFVGCIQCASPIKLPPRFRKKNKESKETTPSTHELDSNLGAADQTMVQQPPFLLRKKLSLANVSCAGTNSTDSLTSSSSSDSLMFRPIVSVSSEDTTFQLPAPEIELLPTKLFYFQNTALSSPSTSDDEWGYFVDFAG